MAPAAGEPPLPDDALARIDTLDHRLTAIERWAGMRPDLDELDQEIALVCREKEAAIDRQDFEAAAATRDKEKQLLAARAARERGLRAHEPIVDGSHFICNLSQAGICLRRTCACQPLPHSADPWPHR